MKITTARDFLNAMSAYFSSGQWDWSDTAWALLLPGFIFMLWLFLYSNPDKSEKDPFSEIPEKDMETIKQIASQKGLSSFDRDFLIMQALNIYVKPVSVLLDQSTFERLQRVLEDRAKKAGNTPEADSNVQNLIKLKSKLF